MTSETTVTPTAEAPPGTTWVSQARAQTVALDRAISRAVAETPTPDLDRVLVRFSDAANGGRLWLATAGVVALVGGRRGRRAAVDAVASVALASVASNVAVKTLARRSRPDVGHGRVWPARQVRRPTSPSFPSGHAASAFAFASTMGEELPPTWVPLHVTASIVAYARVHTGVHYPSDVVVGALVGAMSGWTVRRVAGRAAHRTPPAGSARAAA
jgi:undecaprenyl-diphosphatase